MKLFYLLIIIFFPIYLSGCRYYYPLSEEKKVPIDPQLIGTWQPIPGKKKSEYSKIKNSTERIYIKKLNDYEMLLLCPFDQLVIELKGHLVDVNGVEILQMQYINPPPFIVGLKLNSYTFFQYLIKKDIGKIKGINYDLIKETYVHEVPKNYVQPQPWGKANPEIKSTDKCPPWVQPEVFEKNKEKYKSSQPPEVEFRNSILNNIKNSDLFIPVEECYFKKVKSEFDSELK